MPYNPQIVISKLPNRPNTPPESTQIQLILNGSPLNLLTNTNEDYIIKATQAIKETMLGSSAEYCIRTIEYLNANNAILSTTNSQLDIASCSRKQVRNAKRPLSKARVLSKDDADKLQEEAEAKEAADIAHRVAIGQKKKEQALKKAQEEADKAERAIQRAQAKDTRETNVEMARMARIKDSLFT
jgi:hypothetical protein